MRIGLLEDDIAQAEVLTIWAQEADHDVHHYTLGGKLLDAVKRETFDLLIIDWNLPDVDGVTVLAKVRERVDWRIPIIFITGRDREEDIVKALRSGADDYMIKPVRKQEVLARIDALARRTFGDEKIVVELPPYRFDMASKVAYKHGEALGLKPREFDLAAFLFRHHDRLLSRAYLLQNVWERGPEINTRTVDTHISRIRTKLSITPADGWRLNTVYQHGYRLERLSRKR